MNTLIIVKSNACNTNCHETVDYLVKKAIKDKKLSVDAIFFRSDAVAIASAQMQKRSDLLDIQDIYRHIHLEFNIPMLVCGGDLQEKGIDNNSLDESFTLAGNVELSMMIANAKRVVEF